MKNLFNLYLCKRTFDHWNHNLTLKQEEKLYGTSQRIQKEFRKAKSNTISITPESFEYGIYNGPTLETLQNGIFIEVSFYASNSGGGASISSNYAILLLPAFGKNAKPQKEIMMQINSSCPYSDDTEHIEAELIQSLELTDESDDEDVEYSILEKPYNIILDIIKKKPVEDLNLFLMHNDDLLGKEEFIELSPITFESKDKNNVIAHVPSITEFYNDFDNTCFGNAYMGLLDSFQEIEILMPYSININVVESRETPCIKIANNVFMEVLRDLNDENKYWFSADNMPEIKEQLSTPEGFIELMSEYQANALLFNDFIRHDDGNSICFTFTAFNDQKALFSFQVNPFDLSSFYSNWINPIKESKAFQLKHHDSFEYDWEVDEIFEDSDCFHLRGAICPQENTPAFVLMYALFIADGITLDPSQSPVKSSIVKSILPEGCNTFNATIIPPVLYNDDLPTWNKTTLKVINKGFNEGLISDDNFNELSQLLMNESSANPTKKMIYCSPVIFHTSSDIFLDHIMAGNIPLGEYSEKSLLESFNKHFEFKNLSKVMFTLTDKSHIK